ncbi:MAG: carboxylating nicotinate-nucleotide diphosphorylase [Micrococcales bacterium]|nr:carboxylating nicotinate-nucleotide diphosphorylase [Micrococcales bacterium]MCL2667763.1 carboxylating nicotinate-nucleotide diphosphorylase [Micrococcales bacterium]
MTEPLPAAEIERLAVMTLNEDLAFGPDVTTLATVPPKARATACLVTRADGVVAGLDLAAAVFDHRGVDGFAAQVRDGDHVTAGEVLAQVTGPVPELLTAERSALNLLTHLSGIATATAAWVDAVAGTGAVVRDTRKTVPGMRAAQKYAVRCGGGENHRMGLGDQALVKDNHVAAAGGIAPAVQAVRERYPEVFCEVECDTLDQVREAVAEKVALVLLDNMDPPTMREAVELCRAAGVRTEASGGLRLDNARAVAETGVDYIAVGALTHSSPHLDIGLDL